MERERSKRKMVGNSWNIHLVKYKITVKIQTIRKLNIHLNSSFDPVLPLLFQCKSKAAIHKPLLGLFCHPEVCDKIRPAL